MDFIHPAIDSKVTALQRLCFIGSICFIFFVLQKCVNASQALCDMLRVSRESSIQMVGPTPLLGTLERCSNTYVHTGGVVL